MKLAAKYSVMLLTLALLAGGTKVEAEDGAKDLFYKQMGRQLENLNTGVQYWIELRRNNETTRVNNKFDFKSGDRIKFHVKANINGFAYIILKEGSNGEHSVLFPDSKMADDNKVKAGTDYALPSDGYLMFDSQPGSEKLLLVVSRTPIQTTDYIKDTAKPRILVASRQPGSKDLVPGSAVVSFDDNATIADLPPDPKKPTTLLVSSDTTAGAPVSTPLPAGMSNSITTVIERDLGSVLALDIVLTHKP